MSHIYLTCLAGALMGFGMPACTGSSDQHNHAENSHIESTTKSDNQSQAKPVFKTIDHSKFGHLSAVYICGDEELQTRHTDEVSTLAYQGLKIDVTRTVSVVDDAFVGESFKGTFKGQSLFFKGKGYDASLTLDDDVISCEKITCIPLGGPH